MIQSEIFSSLKIRKLHCSWAFHIFDHFSYSSMITLWFMAIFLDFYCFSFNDHYDFVYDSWIFFHLFSKRIFKWYRHFCRVLALTKILSIETKQKGKDDSIYYVNKLIEYIKKNLDITAPSIQGFIRVTQLLCFKCPCEG